MKAMWAAHHLDIAGEFTIADPKVVGAGNEGVYYSLRGIGYSPGQSELALAWLRRNPFRTVGKRATWIA